MPRSSTQRVCGLECAIQHSYIVADKHKAKQAKIERITHRKAIADNRPLSWYIKRAQSALNRWIVQVRDKDQGCISCGTTKAEQYHAGHYIPTTRAVLRFNPDNIHKQCLKCNNYLHGNLTAYKPSLDAKCGNGMADSLEAAQHALKRYTRDELISIRDKYTNLLRDEKKTPSD